MAREREEITGYAVVAVRREDSKEIKVGHYLSESTARAVYDALHWFGDWDQQYFELWKIDSHCELISKENPMKHAT